MTKSVSLFLAAAFLFGGLALGSLEAEKVRLHVGTPQACLPQIITMKNGDLMAVYSSGTHFNGDARLYFRIYSQASGTWSAAQVAVQRQFSSAYAQLAIDSAGDIHMTYHDGNSSANREIYYAMYSNAQRRWLAPHIAYLNTGINDSWPRIQVEGDKIYISWCFNYADGNMDITLIENTKGGAWPVDRRERKTISNTYPMVGDPKVVSIHPDFGVFNGMIHALWMDTMGTDGRVRDGAWRMRYNEGVVPAGGEFPPSSVLLPGRADLEYYPALTVDSSGTVHIMFSWKIGPYFHMMKKPGGTWSEPTALPGSSYTNQNTFAYMRYLDGMIHAVFNRTESDGEAMVYVRGLPPGAGTQVEWAQPIIVARGLGLAEYPWMTLDHNGDAHVIWSDGPDDTTRSIWYSKVELPGVAPQAVIDVDKTRGLIPLTVRFDAARSTASTGGIRKYMWDFGDGNTAEGRTVTHTYTEKGSYRAVLRVLDNNFRVGQAFVMIEASTGEPFAVIKTLPEIPRGVVPFRVEFDGSDSFDEDGHVVSYEWNFGDGNTATGPIVSHTYTTGGTYSASLTVTDNDAKTNTESVTVNVFQKPTAAFTATPAGGRVPLDVVFCALESTDEDGRIVSYQWDFGDGQYGEGVTVTHRYIDDGPFTVQLTVIDNDGYVDLTHSTVSAVKNPLPPTNLSVRTEVNRTLLHRDYVNRVSWQSDPRNSEFGFNVTQYLIYRKLAGGAEGQFQRVGEVGAGQLHFDDRNHSSVQEAARYVYAVTAVDNEGREGKHSIPVSPSGSR